MISGIHLYYGMKLEKNGKVIKQAKKRVCKSFVKQFLQFLLLDFSSTRNNGVSMRDITNTYRTNLTGTYLLVHSEAVASSGTSSVGIVVGNSDTAVLATDYKLWGQIAHGTSSTQLQYGASVVGEPTTDATSSFITFTRVFTNASGGIVAVKEIGLYFAIYGGESGSFMAVRDVLPATINVPIAGTLTINYTMKITP